MLIEKKLEELNIKIPPCPKPAAVYASAILAGDFIYVSGHTPKDGETLIYKGKIGHDQSIEEGYEAAKICAVRCISAIKHIIGDLDRIERIVKITGYVNCNENFTMHSNVINGASEFLEKVFGEKGKHARSAVGSNSLPGDASVELEMIIKLK